MKVIIRERAADDLDERYNWIAKDNPRAARDMVLRVHDRIAWLERAALATWAALVDSRAHGNWSNTHMSSFTGSPTTRMKSLSFPSFTVPAIQNASHSIL